MQSIAKNITMYFDLYYNILHFIVVIYCTVLQFFLKCIAVYFEIHCRVLQKLLQHISFFIKTYCSVFIIMIEKYCIILQMYCNKTTNVLHYISLVLRHIAKLIVIYYTVLRNYDF